jgi:hypothetical protein
MLPAALSLEKLTSSPGLSDKKVQSEPKEEEDGNLQREAGVKHRSEEHTKCRDDCKETFVLSFHFGNLVLRSIKMLQICAQPFFWVTGKGNLPDYRRTSAPFSRRDWVHS